MTNDSHVSVKSACSRAVSSRAVCLSAAMLLGLGVAAVGSGCASDPTKGYAFASSYDETVRTVSVAMFNNPTYQRGIEVELADAIIKQIQSSTPWRVVPSGDGNSTLTGSFSDARLRRLSVGRDTGLSQELAMELTVDFQWKDARTGKTLVSRKNFTASDTFVPAQGVGERIEVGMNGAVQRLARDIVNEMRSNW